MIDTHAHLLYFDDVDEIIEKCYWEWTEHDNPHEIELNQLNNENACYPLNIKENNTISKECCKKLIRLRSEFRK